jgi:uncharacterized membrane protein YdjX (TVP38/TMEM64 family)
MKQGLIRAAFFGLILAAAFFANRYGLLQSTLDWIERSGTGGPFLFLLIYALSCVFFVPSFVFTFSGGILFGVVGGVLLSALGNGIGSLGAFLIGRYLARDFVERKVSSIREFQRLSLALKKRGWKVILLARISPVFPFLIGNYAFGTTRIPAGHYLLASVVGTIPSALVYSYLGFVSGDLALLSDDGRQRTPAEWILLAAGLGATVLLAWYLRRIAERDLSGPESDV